MLISILAAGAVSAVTLGILACVLMLILGGEP
jgi:hypothetical protein